MCRRRGAHRLNRRGKALLTSAIWCRSESQPPEPKGERGKPSTRPERCSRGGIVQKG
jgi:hypothetical protein